VSIQRRAFGGLADLPLVVDPIRAMPPACRHVIDFAWRLTAPAIAAGRDAVYWRDAGGRVVGLAAWQQAWATLDFYVRPGPDAVTVERDIFAWAGGGTNVLRRALSARAVLLSTPSVCTKAGVAIALRLRELRCAT